jgi:hypothetical protein
MTTEEKLMGANNAMNDILRRSGVNYINVLDEKIKMYSETDKMITPKSYEHAFDILQSGKEKYITFKEAATNLASKTNEFKEHVNIVLEKLNDLSEEINKNKFKYGLKGQIKQSIELNGEMPEMTEEQQHAFEQPYAQTPADIVGKGGKKTRRRRKSKRSKSKRRKIIKRH